MRSRKHLTRTTVVACVTVRTSTVLGCVDAGGATLVTTIVVDGVVDASTLLLSSSDIGAMCTKARTWVLDNKADKTLTLATHIAATPSRAPPLATAHFSNAPRRRHHARALFVPLPLFSSRRLSQKFASKEEVLIWESASKRMSSTTCSRQAARTQ